jgi:transcriptional regulator GlxA family with amidase domain
MKEIIRLRIEHIASLLLETDMLIDQITAASTFYSASHLIRVFKQYKGISPAAFRKKHIVI